MGQWRTHVHEKVRGRYRDRDDVRFDTDSDTDPAIPGCCFAFGAASHALWRAR